MAHEFDPKTWFTGPGQAAVRWPKDRGWVVPRVPLAGGEYPEQWSTTRTFAINETAQLLQLNLALNSDHVMVWSEESGAGAGRFTVTEHVPRGTKQVEFDVGPGGGNQALVRGAVNIQFTATQPGTIITCWVYPGDVLDRAPIQNVILATALAPNPGPWFDLGIDATTQGWPPKDRNNVTVAGEGSFDFRVLDILGNVIIQRNNRNMDSFYHPPIGRLQARNPGAVANLRVVATWRRTA